MLAKRRQDQSNKSIKESSSKEEDALFMDVSLWKGVPEMFKPLVIKPGRFGVDDFDFKSHNSTPHATLENSASNSPDRVISVMISHPPTNSPFT